MTNHKLIKKISKELKPQIKIRDHREVAIEEVEVVNHIMTTKDSSNKTPKMISHSKKFTADLMMIILRKNNIIKLNSNNTTEEVNEEVEAKEVEEVEDQTKKVRIKMKNCHNTMNREIIEEEVDEAKEAEEVEDTLN